MTTAVPVIMLLGILWALYDRECALALTVLGASLFCARRTVPACMWAPPLCLCGDSFRLCWQLSPHWTKRAAS
ncbi:MAG: hypothetical protein ACLU38_06945 [Dysosmobacter sp.]